MSATASVLEVITKALQRERGERERLILSLLKLELVTENLLKALDREPHTSPTVTDRVTSVRQTLDTLGGPQVRA
jgi:hypothetical protein